MSDTIKTILSIIGSLILICFISFCIAMCSTSFRNKVFDILNVVPEKEYNEVVDNEKLLNTQIKEYTVKINVLNDQKSDLINRISQLDLTNKKQSMLLEQYQNEINDLNKQIVELSQKLSEITTNINNVTVTYLGEEINLFFAMFDDNGNYAFHTGYNSNINNYQYNAKALLIYLNDEAIPFVDRISKSIASIYQTEINLYDAYEITMENVNSRMTLHRKSYQVVDSATVNSIITLDNSEISFDDIQNTINADANYSLKTVIDFELNDRNEVISITSTFAITTIA